MPDPLGELRARLHDLEAACAPRHRGGRTPAAVEELARRMFLSRKTNQCVMWDSAKPSVRTFYRRLARVAIAHMGGHDVER